jgi:hypothetical protein
MPFILIELLHVQVGGMKDISTGDQKIKAANLKQGVVHV